MSSEGPYGRQGFQSNPSGYGNYGGGGYAAPQYGQGQGYGGGAPGASYSAPSPQSGSYGGGGGYGQPPATPGYGDYQVRSFTKREKDNHGETCSACTNHGYPKISWRIAPSGKTSDSFPPSLVWHKLYKSDLKEFRPLNDPVSTPSHPRRLCCL